jgi:hypothetical protein
VSLVAAGQFGEPVGLAGSFQTLLVQSAAVIEQESSTELRSAASGLVALACLTSDYLGLPGKQVTLTASFDWFDLAVLAASFD